MSKEELRYEQFVQGVLETTLSQTTEMVKVQGELINLRSVIEVNTSEVKNLTKEMSRRNKQVDEFIQIIKDTKFFHVIVLIISVWLLGPELVTLFLK